MMSEEQKPVKRDHIDELFVRLEEMQARASVGAVFGQPVTLGEKVVIPLASVAYGFGLGFGEGADQAAGASDSGTAGGGGGGMTARPLGVIEITPEHTRVEPYVNEQAVTLAGILFGAWSVFWVAAAVIRIMGGRRTACC
jgi:uncharacterized spore protein YtfJ